MKRRRFHQVVFALAGAYNLGWGAYSALDPQWLFRFAGMPLSNYPEIFACLGMVVGVYDFSTGRSRDLRSAGSRSRRWDCSARCSARSGSRGSSSAVPGR